jgi:tetratricopeptide (TPR) repeat protein
VHERLGNLDAAEADAAHSLELSAADDVINFAFAWSALALVRVRQGEPAAAEELARGAVEHAETTDFPLPRKTARLALAEVLAAGGRTDEAIVQAQLAEAVMQAKEHQPGAHEARAVLARLSVRRPHR